MLRAERMTDSPRPLREFMDPLLTLSGTRLARMIRSREVSSRDVVEAHIRQVQQVNPALNAMVETRFEQARQEALEADERVAREDPEGLPPLLGVPCSIKEAFAFEGMPNTSGLVSRKGVRATHDATAVRRLREAGAIPLGVTNISELCMWMESDNNVYGRTNNPYDQRCTVGGSSGGEGAIIAAGGSPFGLGSDVGGSIRLPAFFNGVFGHKPTGGLIPNTGQFPIAHNEARRYLTTGPLCRRAEDLYPLVRILAGPDGQDLCIDTPLQDPSSVSLRRLTVIDVADNGVVDVSDDLREAQRRAGDALAAAGARVRRVRIPGLRRSLQIWSAMLEAAGGPTFAELMGGGDAIHPEHELLRWMTFQSPHTLPAIGLALLEQVPKLIPSGASKFVEVGLALRKELVERIGPNGVMLYPSYATPAPRHVKPLLPPLRWIYTAIINAMEMPSTQVPLGLNRHGLPLGVQVVATHGNDHLGLAVAMELERAFGGWVPPELGN